MAELWTDDDPTEEPAAPEPAPSGIDRRRFLTWVMAAPVLTVGVKAFSGSRPAAAQVPKVPQVGDGPMDLGRQLQLANMPTEHLVKLEVGEDSIVRFEMHRMEVGQGITTASAMLIADEMGIPLGQVEVTLRDAAPELVFNQLTGGSATIRHFYRPVRQAAAAAREQLMGAAAEDLGVPRDALSMDDDGQVAGPGGPWPIGAFTALAASYELPTNTLIQPKPIEEQSLIGTPTRRIDARDIVTGQRSYAMDIEVSGAKPMMVRRAPQMGGTPNSIRNADAVRAMSGVIDLVELPKGIGVVAETFGQAEVAKNALEVDWTPGVIAGQDDDDIFDELRDGQLPFSVPGLGPVLGTLDSFDAEFTWPFLSHGPMETNCAIADVREDSAEFWGGLKIPIIALQDMARDLGLDEDQVRVHVVPGGASMGRKLFHDAMTEAALASQQVGFPIKNLWTRLDDIRHGRGRAPAVHRIRVTTAGDDVVSYEHRMSGLASSGEHGLGEALTAVAGRTANAGISQAIFHGVIETPYDFGVVTALLNEPVDTTIETGSWRSPYSSQVRPCEEVLVDELAERFGEDPYEFRRRFITADRLRNVLDLAAEAGEWGKEMPDGFAQGIAVHAEYNSYSCYVVELDARDPSDPRVTRSTCAVDVGNPINPSGLEQMMNGALADGIGAALRWGCHFRDGAVVESSYSDFKITKQKHYPRDTKVIVVEPNSEDVGGAGELGVAGATAAVACAFARATGRQVRSFPVNFDIDFDVVPDVPHHPTFDARGA